MHTVFETATYATLRCSLNINIPASMTIIWMLNGVVLRPSNTTQNDQTTILRLRSPPQDGVYQCIFNDAVGYILRRSITLVGMCTGSYKLSKGAFKKGMAKQIRIKSMVCVAIEMASKNKN